MGTVRMQVYNQQLMDSYHYSNIAHIKILLREYSNIEHLTEKGDQVAFSIMIDLKTCLGEYGMSQTTLTEREIYIIRLNLIDGIPQEEIAEQLNIRQNWASTLMSRGLKKMRKQLESGKGDSNENDS